MWLRRAEEEARAEGQTVAVDWRTFSLEQVNSTNTDTRVARRAHGEPSPGNSKTPEVKVWEHPEARSRGVAALAAAQAARLLNPGRLPAFHMGLFEARHEQARDLADPATLDAVATAAGYDREAFARARVSPEAWAAVGRDHEAAVALGVFGTPTLVVGDQAVFLKMQPLPENESALEVLEEVLDLLTRRRYVLELKKPASMTARPRP